MPAADALHPKATVRTTNPAGSAFQSLLADLQQSHLRCVGRRPGGEAGLRFLLTGCRACFSQTRKQQGLLVQPRGVVLNAVPAAISTCGAPCSLPGVCFVGHPPPRSPQVWGGYDILLAHNTLVRVGCGTPAQDLHRAAIDVLFCERSCGGEGSGLQTGCAGAQIAFATCAACAGPSSCPARSLHQCSPALGCSIESRMLLDKACHVLPHAGSDLAAARPSLTAPQVTSRSTLVYVLLRAHAAPGGPCVQSARR